MDDDAAVRLVRERILLDNPFATIYDDEVEFPGSRMGRHLRIVEGGGLPGVAVLAESAGTYALVRTYRYARGSWEWALPRGFGHSADPCVTARAELVEELGAEPVELVALGEMTPNSGLLAGSVHLLFARYGTAVSAPVDTDEVSAVRWVDLPTLTAEIRAGGIVDGFTLAALAAAAVRGLLHL